MLSTRALGLPLALCALAAPGSAQATKVLGQPDSFDPAPSNPFIASVVAIGVNGVGGYAVRVWTTALPQGGFVWGTAGTAPPAILAQGFDNTVGALGLSDTGQTFQWAMPSASFELDGVPVAAQGDPVPGVASAVFATPQVFIAGLTGDGVPYYVYELENPSTAAILGMALFQGAGATAPVLMAGDPLPAVGEQVGKTIVDAQTTHDGAHWVAIVRSEEPAERWHVLLDGDVMQVGGGFLSEGDAVPGSVGGLPGEVWQEFTSVRRNDAGETILAGATSEGGFLLKNDEIVLREGQAVDGHTPAGTPTYARIDESSRIAWTWNYDVDDFLHEAFGIDDHFVLRDGQPVDWDGDGVVDPDFVFLGGYFPELVEGGPLLTDSLVLEPVNQFYYALLQYDLDGLFTERHTISAAGDQVEFFVDAGEERAGDGYWLVGSATGTSPGFAIGTTLVPLNFDPYFVKTIQVPNGPVFVDTLGILDAEGEAACAFSIPAVPSAIGIELHHAALVFELTSFLADEVTAPLSIVVVP